MTVPPETAAGVARRYGFAILAATTALVVRMLLAPVMGSQYPYHTAWAAVAFSAWYCGLGPAIATVLIELAGIWYWFLPTLAHFRFTNPRAEFSGMLGFLVFSVFIILMGETNRRSLARSRLVEAQLSETHAELEEKVKKRTLQLQEANDGLRELSSRLQQLRDDERRSIARELHDSVGQLLAALNMNVDTLRERADALAPDTARLLADCAQLVQQITREVRTISYLLHPPLLDVAGLTSAIRWYVDGFSERSHIQVDLEIPKNLRRISSEMELAVFRMVQECLTNIHRHSGSDIARIVIRQGPERLTVEVRDSGKGIPADKQMEIASSARSGIGFRGMRERLRQLGGDLDIHSSDGGTVVIASLPLSDADKAADFPTSASA